MEPKGNSIQKTRRSKRNQENGEDPETIARFHASNGTDPDWIQKYHIDGLIGYGVFAEQNIHKGQFVANYFGELISTPEGERRLAEQQNDSRSYVYFFEFKKVKFCIDATNVKGKCGHFINDAKNANCIVKVIKGVTHPHLCIFACKDILKDTEFRYNYKASGLYWRTDAKYRIYRNPLTLDFINKNEHCDFTIIERKNVVAIDEDSTIVDKNEDSTIDNVVVDEDPAIDTVVVDEDPTIDNVVVDEDPAIDNVVVDEDPAIDNVVVDEYPAIDTVVVDEDPTIDNVVVDGDPAIDNVVVDEDPAIDTVVVDENPAIDNVVVDEYPTIDTLVVDEDPAIDNVVVDEYPAIDTVVVDGDPAIDNVVVVEDPAIDTVVVDENPAIDNVVVDEDPAIDNGVTDEYYKIDNGDENFCQIKDVEYYNVLDIGRTSPVIPFVDSEDIYVHGNNHQETLCREKNIPGTDVEDDTEILLHQCLPNMTMDEEKFCQKKEKRKQQKPSSSENLTELEVANMKNQKLCQNEVPRSRKNYHSNNQNVAKTEMNDTKEELNNNYHSNHQVCLDQEAVSNLNKECSLDQHKLFKKEKDPYFNEQRVSKNVLNTEIQQQHLKKVVASDCNFDQENVSKTYNDDRLDKQKVLISMEKTTELIENRQRDPVSKTEVDDLLVQEKICTTEGNDIILEDFLDTDGPEEKEISNDSGFLLDESMSVINTDDEDDVDDCEVKDDTEERPPDVNDVKKKKNYKKPLRPCPFCNELQSRLPRHLIRKHKDREEVKKVLRKPTKERNIAFSQLRKLGIFKHNIKQTKEVIPQYMQERKPKSDQNLSWCTQCKGFFQKASFFRHKEKCRITCNARPMALPMELINHDDEASSGPEDFKKNVLASLQNDNIGVVCKSDPYLLIIGSRLYTKVKHRQGKEIDAVKTIRAEMRRLANLYLLFKQEIIEERHNNTLDMFERVNFDELKKSIFKYTSIEQSNSTKPGLKHCLKYTIIKASKILKGTFLVKENDQQARAIEDFMAVYRLHEDELFADAEYQLNKNRQIRLRKPANFPLESDIQKLRNYVVERINYILSDGSLVWDSHAYVELRDLVCCRLTFFNARRGGEPARLLLEELKEAYTQEWISRSKTNDLKLVEKDLVKTLKITFQSGKGRNHLVPIMIPDESANALLILSNPSKRRQVGVANENIYVFASTQDSLSHVCGSLVTKTICERAGVTNSNVTATGQRHLVSTIFASYDVPECERALFYKHMGHSREMNEEVYQAPQALSGLVKIGRRLKEIDEAGGVNLRDNIADNNISKDCIEREKSVSEKITTTCKKVMSGVCKQRYEDNECDESESEFDDDDDDEAYSEEVFIPPPCKRKNYPTRGKEFEGNISASSTPLIKKSDINESGRKYSKWTDKMIKKLYNKFGEYIHGKTDKSFPDRSTMEQYASEVGIDYYTLRTKINNDRAKLESIAKRRQKLIGI